MTVVRAHGVGVDGVQFSAPRLSYFFQNQKRLFVCFTFIEVSEQTNCQQNSQCLDWSG